MANAAQRLDVPQQVKTAASTNFLVIQTSQDEHLQGELQKYDAMGFEAFEIISLGPKSQKIVFRRKELNPLFRIALELRMLRKQSEQGEPEEEAAPRQAPQAPSTSAAGAGLDKVLAGDKPEPVSKAG